MALSDLKLLSDIKKKIVKDANLQDTVVWSQKDFEFISYFVEERTGCRLSVSTLKRIWSNEHQRLPHVSTLDALSSTAFGKNWQSLKSASLSNKAKRGFKPFKGILVNQEKRLRQAGIGLLLSIPIVLILLGGARGFKEKHNSKKEILDVAFGHKMSLENKLPNTVVFTYDIEALEANRFFLQQSWDASRKVEIFKGTHERTDIYYVPGYFTAKLFADDEIVKEMPVHVVYDDWFIAARQPMSNIVTFDRELWSRQDYLGLEKEAFGRKGIDLQREFQLAFYYVRDFEVDGDNLAYKASFKMEPLESVDCPIFNIHLQGTEGYYWVMIGNKGCGSELSVRLGDRLHNGKTEDLTQLTTLMYQWNQFGVYAMDRKVQLTLNGTEVLSTSYAEAIGDIMEISYFFNGIGMVDNVELTDGEGKIKFLDDLEFDDPLIP